MWFVVCRVDIGNYCRFAADNFLRLRVNDLVTPARSSKYAREAHLRTSGLQSVEAAYIGFKRPASQTSAGLQTGVTGNRGCGNHLKRVWQGTLPLKPSPPLVGNWSALICL
jgi:hypothetical protein